MDLLTFLWLLIAVVAGLALEVYGIVSGRGTITGSIRKAFHAYPPTGMLVGLVIGLLMGHFFWQ